MSHNITYNSFTNQYEVMTRGAAWHNLGQVVQDVQTWEETMRLANLDWQVQKRQLSYNGIDVPAWALFRSDIQDVEKSFLATTTETFEPIQNQFMFSFLDTMIEADGLAHYESAGSLEGGVKVFACVNLGTAFEIGNTGDRFENYMVFVEDRTGGRAAKCFITTVRVVCANTFEQAYSGAKDAQTVKFHHRANVTDKLVQAAGLFTGARMDLTILKQKFERLADRIVTRDTLQTVLDRMFPAETEKQAISTGRENKMIDVLKLFENNDHNMFPEIRGTAYNLFNAATEYVDHFQPVRRTASRMTMTDDQIRSERAFVGAGADWKGSILDIILEETATAPLKTRRAQSVSIVQELINAPAAV